MAASTARRALTFTTSNGLPEVRARGVIRAASSADADWVAALSGRVFAHLGDYWNIVREWLVHPYVFPFVVEDGGERAGFAMLARYRFGDHWRGELLAIAVSPERHHQGFGRLLLEHAIRLARQPGSRQIDELYLSVAEPNARARRLFESAGFALIEGDHGTYDKGQRAQHMRMPLTG